VIDRLDQPAGLFVGQGIARRHRQAIGLRRSLDVQVVDLDESQQRLVTRLCRGSDGEDRSAGHRGMDEPAAGELKRCHERG
jgi:hypothetical protein